ncbi:unnamed protein product [Thelazia callipaeda]|uniref:DB domain-containing protein n=1 Tax=Thelazia callipaeda TaxID=103827 RepID=A0A0N5D013_THECL|nr:unnamed protein product [Thelazia callipaeda]
MLLRLNYYEVHILLFLIKYYFNQIYDENGIFLECCRERGLPDVCLKKCSYLTYNQNTLRNMFLRLDSCPIQAANDIHFCAAQGHDHRQCCAMNEVTSTSAHQKCLIFCDQRPTSEIQLNLSYLPCIERFENIKGCFWRWAQKQYKFAKDAMMEARIRDSRRLINPLAQTETDSRPPSPFSNR